MRVDETDGRDLAVPVVAVGQGAGAGAILPVPYTEIVTIMFTLQSLSIFLCQ